MNSEERQLWAAVLQQAIDDLSDKDELIKSSAINWLNSKLTDFNSFIGVCEILEIDPDRARTNILAKYSNEI